jgi:dimethylglycine dehydrogenase
MLADARVAIVGGGVAGCSLLYHLGLAGWEDAVLLEEDELTSGSTWHAAGLCTQFNPSYNLTGLLRYSVERLVELDADYHECGSLRLATTEDRVDEFRHRAATAELLGVPVELVGPERVRELHPLVEVGELIAAAYLPTDGHVDPSSLSRAFAA